MGCSKQFLVRHAETLFRQSVNPYCRQGWSGEQVHLVETTMPHAT